ncbi:VOC family protein [Salinicoccus roseus]|uniref:Glyoxalase/bleomycin resistance/extradiol dioxygenase family protein n=1 Tax=Salinicoccus roseus TaxID=45670 RepID=A0A265E7J9_9STAP|nr:VOC family protein [Salinicoccus roseus]OZT77490.1 glyoxalase/bleomycin resistance/extradiol dioxygenase family protein [Salinicoccus roseus]
MFTRIGEVMLYVNDQEATRNFWREKLGFIVASESEEGADMKWIELKPTREAETSIILHDRKLIEKLSPELNFGTPSLMFFTDDLDRLHEELSEKGVKVGEIETFSSERTFNFADNEENYFAVMENNE